MKENKNNGRKSEQWKKTRLKEEKKGRKTASEKNKYLRKKDKVQGKDELTTKTN